MSDAEKTEQLICQLHHYRPMVANVLRLTYLDEGPLRHKAKQLGLSASQFYVHLDQARYFLAGRLHLI